ncbi:MAG: hypothetical protein U0637_11395 [Phycisphaerales bacterium]
MNTPPAPQAHVQSLPAGVHIEALTRAQARPVLEQLVRFHYRPGAPASPARTLCARGPRGEPVAVLCTAFPTLNAPWRCHAWPELLQGPQNPSARARLLNQHVRTIARVIVDPRWRGLGLASALVREYLRAPETPLTEAVASMGRFSPFFEAAGMRTLTAPPARRDRHLAAALHSLHISPLACTEAGHARATLRRYPALLAALRTWARSSRATRRHAGHTRAHELLMLAAQTAARHGLTVYAAP